MSWRFGVRAGVAVALSAVTLVAAAARAQEPRTSTRVVLAASARVERIDLSTRSLTVRTAEGLVHTVYVGPELKVFRELKTGDIVDVRVAEEVIVALNPTGKPTVIIDSTAAARKQGRGSTEVLQQLKATVTIESVDPGQQVVTYKTADNRRVMRMVADPRLLEGLKAGDVIDIMYTRERAVEIARTR
jgi:phage FluMu protein gp41